MARNLNNDSPQPATRKRISQIGLSTLLLMTACVAVGYSHWTTQRKIRELKDRLAVVRPLVRELNLKDRDHLSAVMLEAMKFDEFAWKVFLPQEGHQLQIATSGVQKEAITDSETGLLPPEDSVLLSPGEHTISLESYLQDQEWITEVTVDLEQVLQIKRPADWNSSSGSIGGSIVDQQVDYTPDTNLILFRRVFTERTTSGNGIMLPNTDGNGVQLWIKSP